MIKNLIFILLIFLQTSVSWADVYLFPDKDIHASLGIQLLDYSIDFVDEETGKNLAYQPNIQNLVTPRISYKGIWGLSWGFKAGENQGDKIILGETDYTDIRFDLALRDVTIQTFYSEYRGFYINNSYGVDPTWEEGDVKFQFPDMYSRVVGAAVTWVLDSDTFSLPNLFNQSERQERRGGSILIGLSLTETKVENEAGIIHPAVRAQYDVLSELKAGTFRTLNLKAGYGYNWPFWRKWYLGGYAQAGFGFLHKELEFLTSGARPGLEPAARGEAVVAVGYNGDDFFSSLVINAMADLLYISGSSSRIVPTLNSGVINVGMHF